jgi:TolB-like protein/DNA-binding CsgD family transcriptional regulator
MEPSSVRRKLAALAAAPAEAAPAPAERSGPAVAVLPFGDLGGGTAGDPGQRYFRDGITEDITTELARFRDILVIGQGSSAACEAYAGDIRRIARELGADYVLGGTVRRAGNRVRITAHLVAGASGDQLWADRHDGAVDDMLDLQEEIARRIVGSIAPEIHLAEQQRAERLSIGDAQAYDLALQAAALVRRGMAADAALLSEAIALAQRAIERDPRCIRAYDALAWAYCRRGALGFFGAEAQADFAAADAAAQRICDLDERNHVAFAIVGHLAMRRLRHDEALASLNEAHRLNPNDMTTLRWLSWEESNLGLAEAARRHAEQSLRLGPRDRAIDLSYWTLGLAHYVAGDLAGAIDSVNRAIAVNRRFAGHYILLAAALAEAGRLAEARATVAAARALDAGLVETRLSGANYFALPALAERYLKALRRAAGEERGRAPAVPQTAAPVAALPVALTRREREVLRLVAQGLSNAAIAESLALSEHTAKRHIANILTKLDLPTRAAAAAFAARHGLL